VPYRMAAARPKGSVPTDFTSTFVRGPPVTLAWIASVMASPSALRFVHRIATRGALDGRDRPAVHPNRTGLPPKSLHPSRNSPKPPIGTRCQQTTSAVTPRLDIRPYSVHWCDARPEPPFPDPHGGKTANAIEQNSVLGPRAVAREHQFNELTRSQPVSIT